MELFSKLKKKVISSFKSVLLNYKEFIGIYIAIIIVQLIVGVWALSAFTNYYANDELFDSNYEYDVIVKGSSNQTMANLANRFRNDMKQKDNCISRFGYSSGGKTVGVVLKDGRFDDFYDEYLDTLVNDNKAEYTLTPKYIYHSEIQRSILATNIALAIVAFAVSVLILSVMYSVRTNHYKFQYGIYMTFGADKKMLGSIALNELLAVNTLTVIPAAILSYVITSIMYSASGVKVVVSFASIMLYLLLTYLSVIIAACTSVGGLFLKTPVALITTADNSNFVSSPRKSFSIFAKKMPLNYELYTTWRFRKYIARLVLGAVAFSVIFVTGIYSANMVRTENNAPKNEFSVNYKFNTATEELRLQANREALTIVEDLLVMENVEKVDFEQSKELHYRSDHILIRPGVETSGSDNTVPSNKEYDGYTRATNSCRYVCLDELAMKNYALRYDIDYLEGYDMEKVLADENMIVVNDESIIGLALSCFSMYTHF